ncbi:MAG: NADH-quinone oxidoreductase subunit N [Elusimicrobia bacterium]|nr:NADH-quinone oxidoreductase subunit N [Elusimicrobiota bacterium]
MVNLALLRPEFVLSALALALLAADLLTPPGRGRALDWGALASCAATLALVIAGLACAGGHLGLGTLWAVDPFSQFLKIVILGSAILSLLLNLDYEGIPVRHAGSFSGLLLLCTVGMMFLVSAVDLLLLFVSLELVSLSSFVLTGYERASPKSNEGALKYFIFGAFAAAVMAFGISLFYGEARTTLLLSLGSPLGPLGLLGLLFILIGFGFKAAMVPMHFWVPDAYEGAPTPVTAFLSVAPKVAALGALARLLTALVPTRAADLTLLLSILCVLTMTVGNFVALFQRNVKRLLAYSSIAQAGYIMIGIVTADAMGTQGVLLYSFVYVAMNIGAFAMAIALAEDRRRYAAGDPYDLSAFDGLAGRSLPAALAMAFFLLSLAGIPPLAGFIGKFYLIGSAVGTRHYWLAVAAVVNSVVSVYYYMSIAYRMFFVARQREAPRRLSMGVSLYGSAALALAAVLALGVLPDRLVAWVQASAKFLP